jgi:hypothetical protein
MGVLIMQRFQNNLGNKYFYMYMENKYRKNGAFYGGAIPIQDDKLPIQLILEMIKTDGAELVEISYDSLVGFIFKLNIPENPENSKFNILDNNNKFTKPLYSYIFKIVILSNAIENLKYINTNNVVIYKTTELVKNFQKEYEIQNKIYYDTISLNGNNICPSVIDFTILDIESANTMLFFLNKISKTAECKKLLNFLYYYIKKHNKKLGMITMEFVDDVEYMLLGDLPRQNMLNRINYKINCSTAIAELVILFIKCRYINYDCHSGNIFGSNSLKKPLLIDFGRMINLNEEDKQLIKWYNYIYDKDNFTYNTNSHTASAAYSDDLEDIPTEIVNSNVSESNMEEPVVIINQESGVYYDDFNNIKDVKLEDFHAYVENKVDEDLKTKLENIIRFIALVDYAANSVINNKILPFPQMNALLRSLYVDGQGNMPRTMPYYWYNSQQNWNTNKYMKIDAFDKSRFAILNFNWKMNNRDFEYICSKIKELSYRVNKTPVLDESVKIIKKKHASPIKKPDFKKKVEPEKLIFELDNESTNSTIDTVETIDDNPPLGNVISYDSLSSMQESLPEPPRKRPRSPSLNQNAGKVSFTRKKGMKKRIPSRKHICNKKSKTRKNCKKIYTKRK